MLGNSNYYHVKCVELMKSVLGVKSSSSHFRISCSAVTYYSLRAGQSHWGFGNNCLLKFSSIHDMRRCHICLIMWLFSYKMMRLRTYRVLVILILHDLEMECNFWKYHNTFISLRCDITTSCINCILCHYYLYEKVINGMEQASEKCPKLKNRYWEINASALNTLYSPSVRVRSWGYSRQGTIRGATCPPPPHTPCPPKTGGRRISFRVGIWEVG